MANETVIHEPLNLWKLSRRVAACGFTSELTLSSHEAATITARLRGINAIASIFLAATDDEEIVLGAWLSSGLMEAINALSSDATSSLERARERAR